jgi:flagellar export protein FliJ
LLQEKIKIVESKRSNLITKSRDHKVLQALKEKQNKTWTKYLEKKESNMLDEIAILHHTRTPL